MKKVNMCSARAKNKTYTQGPTTEFGKPSIELWSNEHQKGRMCVKALFIEMVRANFVKHVTCRMGWVTTKCIEKHGRKE